MINKTLAEILKYDNWEEILTDEPFNFKVSRDDGYIIIKYLLHQTDLHVKAVEDARGIILDENTLEPVCIPFKKFYNYGEPLASELKGKFIIAEEKLDGSLIKVWKHRGKLRVSTNGTINAYNTPVNDWDDLSFGELFEESVLRMDFLEEYVKEGITHMFELTTPKNIIVIKHEHNSVTYLGSSSKDRGFYKDAIMEEAFGSPKSYIYVVDKVREEDGMDEWIEGFRDKAEELGIEGYVLTDLYGNKVKVKSREYIENHYLSTSLHPSKRNLLRIVAENEVDEVLTVRPDLKSPLDDMKYYYDRLMHTLRDRVNKLIYLSKDRKEIFVSIEEMDLSKEEKALTKLVASNTLARKAPIENFTQSILDSMLSVIEGYINAEFDGSTIADLIMDGEVDLETLTGMTEEELYGGE